MEAALPLILTCVIGVTVASVAAILLRTPVKLVDMGSRLSGAEREIAELDAKVKKALRRIGIEAKKAAQSTAPEPPSPAHPELPFEMDEDEEPDPLDAAARFARLNGKARQVTARLRSRR